MCVRKAVSPVPLKLPSFFHRNHWTMSSMPRLATPQASDSVARYTMLGNSIIPQVARLAFVRLYTGFEKYGISDVQRNQDITFNASPSHKFSTVGVSHGFTLDGATHRFGSPSIESKFTVHIHPRQYAGSMRTSRRAILPAIQDTVVRHAFPTPRAHMWRNSSVLTLRTLRDLPTFALFAKQIQGVTQSATSKEDKVNIRFVEWLMGYPAGYTEMDRAST